jgi:catechol 2,3-dioxygenase-like lactoylglutathione lyase family enzyme
MPTPQLNHTIVQARDAKEAATFLTEILGLPNPRELWHFQVVELSNEVSLDYVSVGDEIRPQHYAFLVSEEEFDEIFGRIRERGLDYWADPFHRQPGEINHNDGGRGVYWEDPNGHNLEIITRPYGSGE